MCSNRRQFLRAGGALMALPFRRSIHASTAVAPRPGRKLVLMSVPNGLVRRSFFPVEENGQMAAIATTLQISALF
jgi:hypothetical protein